ncbi:MAG: XisI protein [Lewinellaceae bacterium]|nr:XisI protein [Lewinellaceae bacterium]
MDKLVKYPISSGTPFRNMPRPPKKKGIEEQLLFDTQRDHYQVLALGWEKGRRVYFCVLHLDIRNGKIWLQENSTDFDIVGVLEEKGVPKSGIVLGFQPEDVREMTEYAVG